MAAERDTVDRLIAAYLSEQIDKTFDARISA
jgi:ribonuclease R